MGNDLNGTNEDSLQILIVGADIGGLTAGIALRQHGHRVTASESYSACSFESGVNSDTFIVVRAKPLCK